MVCGCRRPAQQPDCVSLESRGRGARPVLPWRALRPPPFPTPGHAWGTYVLCGCCQAGTTTRANALTQIVPNSTSLFYSVIYNSVVYVYSLEWLKLGKKLPFLCFSTLFALRQKRPLPSENLKFRLQNLKNILLFCSKMYSPKFC